MKFKESKSYQDYMEYKKLSNLYSKPKVSKKTRSYKGIDLQMRRKAKNLKDLQAAQDFKNYTAGKSSSPETQPSSSKSRDFENPKSQDFENPKSRDLKRSSETSVLRRSARLRKIDAHVVQEFPNFNSNYFGSVPGYVDEEDKAKIDKIFLDYKNSHCEDSMKMILLKKSQVLNRLFTKPLLAKNIQSLEKFLNLQTMKIILTIPLGISNWVTR